MRPSDKELVDAFNENYYFDSAWQLRWKRQGHGKCYGDKAGHSDGHGYMSVCLLGGRYKLHRIVYLLTHGVYPEGHMDHIDGDRLNNHPNNLRLATPAQNVHNRIRAGALPTGVQKGERGRYMARIQNADGKKIYLGYYDTAQEAAAAYAGASIVLYGEFAPKLSRAA